MFTLLPKSNDMLLIFSFLIKQYLLFPNKAVHDHFFVMKLKCLCSNMTMKGDNYKLFKFSIFEVTVFVTACLHIKWSRL